MRGRFLFYFLLFAHEAFLLSLFHFAADSLNVAYFIELQSSLSRLYDQYILPNFVLN